jgi:hypothetical protein
MRIKSIVAVATIALATGIGSASADELSVADTAVNTGTPFAMLDGIATEQLSVQELAATRGAYLNNADIKPGLVVKVVTNTFSTSTAVFDGPYVVQSSRHTFD